MYRHSWLALLHALNSDLLVVGFGKVWLAIYRCFMHSCWKEKSLIHVCDNIWHVGGERKNGYIGALALCTLAGTLSGTSNDYSEYTFGALLVHFWYTFGALLVHFWYTFGIFMVHLSGAFALM